MQSLNIFETIQLYNTRVALLLLKYAGGILLMKILIVEDEKNIMDLICLNLTKTGYDCECASDGMDAADRIENKRYDLILLDIMLPGADGYELMDYIKTLEIPVIFITAKSRVEDKVKGLKMGADDYITKPFELAELNARVESVLRRYRKKDQQIEIAGVEIDLSSRMVKLGDKVIDLTMKEFDLLLLFIRNRNIALFRERIYEEVWESEYTGDSRTVDIHVLRLRKKLCWEDKIISIRKIGYRLES